MTGCTISYNNKKLKLCFKRYFFKLLYKILFDKNKLIIKN